MYVCIYIYNIVKSPQWSVQLTPFVPSLSLHPTRRRCPPQSFLRSLQWRRHPQILRELENSKASFSSNHEAFNSSHRNMIWQSLQPPGCSKFRTDLGDSIRFDPTWLQLPLLPHGISTGWSLVWQRMSRLFFLTANVVNHEKTQCHKPSHEKPTMTGMLQLDSAPSCRLKLRLFSYGSSP